MKMKLSFTWFLWVIVLLFNEDVDGQFTVTIFSNPAGTPVSGTTNTFDYPILSSVTLKCRVTSSDESTPTVTNYQWNTTECFTNNAHNTPTCFPTGQTTQNVTGNNLLAEDAGTITCTVTIDGVDYTSGPLTLHISGIAIFGASNVSTDLVSSNQIIDYSFVTQPFILAQFNEIIRCATGLGPSGRDSYTVLGGWYFNGAQLPQKTNCGSPAFAVRGANPMKYPGVINLYKCGAFTTTEEGVYSCIMMNSSMMNQTIRVGVYVSRRTAPMIDTPLSPIKVFIGSPLILSCTSRGSPPDIFTWRKDGGPIVQSTSITTVTHTSTSAVFRADYSINSVTTSDSGTYTCTVTNPIGSDSNTITVVGPTVTIVSNPAGTPVTSNPAGTPVTANTFDYPILSSVTLTCTVDPSPPAGTTYQWNTGGCFTNSAHNTTSCFPTGQTTQNVTGNNLLAEDAGTVTCTVTIGGVDYTSVPLTLHISGITMFGASDVTTDLVSSNQITDYSFVTQPFKLDQHNVILRCATGLGPSGKNANTGLGGWYFNGIQISLPTKYHCHNSVLEVRGANGRNYPGMINLYLCGTFTTIEEGVYSCIMMNSSMMNQTMRVGVYCSGRTAPMIDTPSSSTVTVVVGSLLTLSCTSRGSPPDTFTWRKDGVLIVQSTSITTVNHTNTSAVFRADYSINNVTTSNSGTYTCIVTNPIGSDSEMFNVTVSVFTVTISPSGPIQGAMVGSPQMIQCTVSTVSGVESSSVMISWMGPGGDTITNDSRVTINPTTSSGNTYTRSIQFTYLMERDEGAYMCNVVILETSGSASVVLETLTIPTPSVTVTAPNTQIVGQSLTLECSVTAVRGITSRVDIIWNSDGTEVERMEGVSVSSTTDNSVVYTDTYTISQLNTTDNGRKYQCEVVINTIQKKSAEDNVSLNVIVPLFNVTISPSGPIQGAMVGSPQMIQCTVSTVSGVESSSVMISWMGPGGDTITNDNRVTINPTTSSGNTYTSVIQFTYLMEGDEGTYMCNVVILETSGSISVVLETLTIPTPSVTVTAPNTQIVGQPLTLECSVTAVRGITSRVDIIWSSDGREVERMDRVSISPTTENLVMHTDTCTISQLGTDDDGIEYECEVVINASPIVTATDDVTLDVTVPPPNITLYQPVQYPDTGSGHNISCSVTVPTGVDPSLVVIDWTMVANSSRVTVIDSYDGSIVTKTGIFQQLRAADNGTYRCSVTINGFTDPDTRNIIVNVASVVNRNGNTELSGAIIGGIISSVLAVVLLLVLLSVCIGIRCYQKSYKKTHAVQKIAEYDIFEIQPSTSYSMRKETPDSISDTSIDNAENDYSDWRRETPIEVDTTTRRNETLHKINSETLSQNIINVN
ncbi:hemicentin-1-like isoform X2 [Dysidea avara]|uniref:hemicentin-1-like isoform X2 n=1 Tax=Dysidea avara TaxID=196820 RepID=UPI00331E2385